MSTMGLGLVAMGLGLGLECVGLGLVLGLEALSLESSIQVCNPGAALP